MSSRNRVRIRARRSGGVDRHPGNAATAAFTAASTSSWLAKGTVRTTAPVAALVTWPDLVPRDVARCPLIHKGTTAVDVATAAAPGAELSAVWGMGSAYCAERLHQSE